MRKYTLRLTGYVGGYNFSSRLVRNTLDAYSGSPVTVLIDSTGGSLAAGLSIARAFRDHGNVTVHFSGFCASAATVASLGAKHVVIDSNAMYMAHKCSVEFFEWANLNADDLQTLIDKCSKQKEELDKIDANIASMYAAKCASKVDDLLAVMQRGAWLSAEEAKAYGFVDEIESVEGSALQLSADAAADFISQGIELPVAIGQPEAAQKADIISRLIAAAQKWLSGLTGREVAADDTTAPIDPDSKSQSHTMDLPSNFAAAAGVTTADEEAGRVTIDAAAIDAVDAAIADRDTRITELEARVAELSAEDGADAQQVHDDAKESHKPADDEEPDAVEAFCKAQASAAKLFNSLP